MTRIQDWLDRPSQGQETDLEILYDQGQTVEVYRRIETGDNTGFGDEVDDPLPLRSINVRVDNWSGSEYSLVGITDDTDVQVNDRWRISTVKDHYYNLVVKSVEYRQNISQCGLERE